MRLHRIYVNPITFEFYVRWNGGIREIIPDYVVLGWIVVEIIGIIAAITAVAILL